MKKKVFNVILIILTIGMIYEGYSFFNIKQDNKVLEDIKTVDVFNNKDKTLSIKVQSGGENDLEWYEPEDRSKWPSKSDYMYVGTKCEDANGTDVGDARPYVAFNENTYTATITTKKTIYCTLYFGKGKRALEVLKGHAIGGSNTTTFTEVDVDGLYRYKGTKNQVTNNYICFGTTSLNECTKSGTNNIDKYLYRIIGITSPNVDASSELEEGQLKIIRAIPSGSSAWGLSEDNEVSWDNCTMKTYLNNTFLNTIEESWRGLIDNPKWWISSSTSGGTENKGTKSKNYQIGLMYQSDYVNAGAQNKTNWLHMSNGRSVVPSSYANGVEATMSRAGSERRESWTVDGSFWTTWYYYWAIQSDGSFSKELYNSYFARPVFYLTSDGVGLVGEGTESSPFRITSVIGA